MKSSINTYANKFKSEPWRVGAIDHGGSKVSSRSNVVISLVIIGIIFGGVGAAILFAAPYEPSRVAIVMMTPGFGDMSKADTIFEGMETIGHDISIQYFHPDPLPTSVSEAREDLEYYASAPVGYYDLIIAVGQDLAPVLQTVATGHPDHKFAMIGAEVDLANVVSATFQSQEAAFLAGVVAAFMADDQRNTINSPNDAQIGILGAVDDEVINVLIDGFIQGVQAANETYDLNVTLLEADYVGSWNNSLTAEGMIYTMFVADKVSVIFAPVRASYHGVREGATRAQATFGGLEMLRRPIVIAAEGNLDYFGTANPDIPVDPSWIVTSAYDRTDWAIYEMINKTLWDQFQGDQTLEYNLTNGGCNITDFTYSSTYVPVELEIALQTYIYQISTGIITVSRNL